MDAVELISRKYRIEPFEYDRPGSRALLVSAGTGLMLSVMDHAPAIRWCVDVDTMMADQKERLADWLQCCGNCTPFIAIAGWYATTNPKPLVAAISRLRRAHFICYVPFHGVGDDPFVPLRTASTLDEFLRQIVERSKGIAAVSL